MEEMKYTSAETVVEITTVDGTVTVTKMIWNYTKTEYHVALNTGCISTSKCSSFTSLEKAMERCKKYSKVLADRYMEKCN